MDEKALWDKIQKNKKRLGIDAYKEDRVREGIKSKTGQALFKLATDINLIDCRFSDDEFYECLLLPENAIILTPEHKNTLIINLTGIHKDIYGDKLRKLGYSVSKEYDDSDYWEYKKKVYAKDLNKELLNYLKETRGLSDIQRDILIEAIEETI